MKKTTSATLFTLLVLATSCKTEKKEKVDDQTTTEQKTNGEWISLFDGTTTKGWRAYNGKELTPGWLAKDG